MYLQMMVVNSELFVLGEKKDKKEDDVDMSDGKQELFREKMEERLCELIMAQSRCYSLASI